MITRISSVIRPKGSDLIFDHPYNDADSVFTVAIADDAHVEHISPGSGSRARRPQQPGPEADAAVGRRLGLPREGAVAEGDGAVGEGR